MFKLFIIDFSLLKLIISIDGYKYNVPLNSELLPPNVIEFGSGISLLYCCNDILLFPFILARIIILLFLIGNACIFIKVFIHVSCSPL